MPQLDNTTDGEKLTLERVEEYLRKTNHKGDLKAELNGFEKDVMKTLKDEFNKTADSTPPNDIAKVIHDLIVKDAKDTGLDVTQSVASQAITDEVHTNGSLGDQVVRQGINLFKNKVMKPEKAREAKLQKEANPNDIKDIATKAYKDAEELATVAEPLKKVQDMLSKAAVGGKLTRAEIEKLAQDPAFVEQVKKLGATNEIIVDNQDGHDNDAIKIGDKIIIKLEDPSKNMDIEIDNKAAKSGFDPQSPTNSIPLGKSAAPAKGR